ncbi:MAG: M16 family peptidase [Parcubacteria group bacterium GW2011_GWB1_46_8]|nr:MAG: M16 family peptidase [Parcubacteria group bacterium GW2011_GWF1_45_5]KKU43591.1 MAG: M16 family peptidase [Parcubacteria group bacterium GW2011_GWA2_46_7]KKU46469.1 MAG: M16 family peptidase [Parcubacteria group bacterium GW2011_GWB1_46_8]KKU47656.1 MAG: M16 family peptidase [Parcubacteria group bacterium GW2011_GWF2_46_8]OGJ05216.1 MAG: hypothetical protein A2357_00975 [Candidatus Nomurabacteria bacterium RIFOXYB1_FULL_43_14]
MGQRKHLSVFTLENGIKVLSYRMPYLKSIYIKVGVRGGRVFEPKNKKGVAHFTEHLIGSGTVSFPTEQELVAHIESFAGSHALSTSFRFIEVDIHGPAPHLENLIRVLYEIVFKPIFSPLAFLSERKAILNELAQKEEKPQTKIKRFYDQSLVVPQSFLSLDALSTLHTTKRLKRKDLVSYWKKIAQPQNIHIVVGGNLDLKELRLRLQKTFGKEHNRSRILTMPKCDQSYFRNKPISIQHVPDYSQIYLDVNFPSVSMKHSLATRMIQRLLCSILADNRSSRLNTLLRIKNGVVYDIGTGGHVMDQFGYTGIYSRVAKNNLNKVIELILQELRDFITRGPTEQEWENAKHYATDRELLRYDNPWSLLDNLEGNFLFEKQILFPDDWNSIRAKLTFRDACKVVKKYWDVSKIQLCIQGNIKNTAQNRKKYQKLLNRYFLH